MTHRCTYTNTDLPPTLAARFVVGEGIHSNKYRPLKDSQPTPNIPLRLLPNLTYHFGSFINTIHTEKPAAARHVLYTILTPFRFFPNSHSMHSAPPAKSNAVFNTLLVLILHLCALAAGQYTLNATQPNMNQHTVASLH